MLIAFLCTMMFLPAAITLFRPQRARGFDRFPLGGAAGRGSSAATAGSLLAVFGVMAALGVVLVPRLVFDSDPLHTRTRIPRRCGPSRI